MTIDKLPSDALFLEALINLSNELNLTKNVNELIEIFTDVFEELLPGKLVAIRLVSTSEKGLELVWANGRLADDNRQLFRITPNSLEGLKLSNEEQQRVFEHEQVERVDEYAPVFTGSSCGFCVALCDRKEFYGAVNFEYEESDESLEADKRVAIPLVHQMTAALKNTHLLAKTILLKNYWEKLLDRANASVFVLDRYGKVVVVNQATERLIACNREEVLGEEFISLVAEEDQARLLPIFISSIGGESAESFEARILKADGTGDVHIAFNTATIYTEFDEVEAVIFVGQDSSAVRNLQRQVIHSEKLATLGQVAAGVAHELNNPLTSITVYTNYLIKKLGGEIEDADLAKMRRILVSAERIQSFTRDLVTYARPSAEEPTLLVISDVIERSISFCEHLINEYRADVSLNIDENVRPVLGIRDQLVQVFVNLLTNACHALPADGGRIEISTKSRADDRIEIVTKDNGCGISGKHLRNVFEPFFTTKEQGDGTGLGLSIARNILDNHDAAVEIESELGKGTSFKIIMRAQRKQ